MEECLNDYQYFFKEDLLAGKVAFITGGGSGIGFTIAEVLMRHGCNTAIGSRNSDRLKKAAEKLMRATGKRCIPLQMDVRNPSEVIHAIDQAICELGTIDILVNGAAGNFLCPVSSLSFNAFKTVIAIDTLGTFNVTKAVYEKSMKKHGGTIINLTATLHYTGTLLQAHAGSAKAAVDALTRHLAVEWGPDIRINSIAPGGVSDTEGMKRLGCKSEALNKAFMATIPLKRFATKEDIANAALYLASGASSYVTGACLVVDGGSWMTQGSLYQLRLDSKL